MTRPERMSAEAQGAETMLVYREAGKNHLPGPNGGTPLTACGLDAGAMERREHPISNAALWCSDCFAALTTQEAEDA